MFLLFLAHFIFNLFVVATPTPCASFAGDFTSFDTYKNVRVKLEEFVANCGNKQCTSVPPDQTCFNSVKNIKIKGAKSTNIEVNSSLFEKFVKIEKLTLLQVRPIDDPLILKNDVFKHMKSTMKHLHIEKSAVTEIPAGAFADYSELVVLDLSKNPLKSISPKVFDQLTKLTQLNLGGHITTEYPINIFHKLTQLQSL